MQPSNRYNPVTTYSLEQMQARIEKLDRIELIASSVALGAFANRRRAIMYVTRENRFEVALLAGSLYVAGHYVGDDHVEGRYVAHPETVMHKCKTLACAVAAYNMLEGVPDAD